MLAVNIVQFILILIGLVLVHEWGHMVVAKKCGMRVERFSIFMGRPLWKVTRGETEYALGWLPIGGYVKISGMTRDEEVPPGTGDRTYHAAKVWKRVATIAAGPGINIVVAFLAFAAMYWIGVPRDATSINRVVAVSEGSPAQKIGLAAGDRIVAVNGVRSTDPERIRELLSARPGKATTVTYRRGDREITRDPVLMSAQDPETGRTVGRLGFSFDLLVGPPVRSGPVEGLGDAASYTWFVTSETGKILARQFTRPDIDQVSSVVGAGAAYNEVAQDGTPTILRFIGLLSLALALFNLLPVPPLDGGHIVFALIEKVRGSPLPRRAFETATVVGLVAIVLLGVVLIQNDIARIANGTLMP